jgi:elongation of very long chain fatty acids protein 6
MANKMRPKWLNPMIITSFQISQMIVGVVVTLLGFYYYSTDETCTIEKENNTAAFVMYGSYLFLFMQFFVGRYYEIASTKKKVA